VYIPSTIQAVVCCASLIAGYLLVCISSHLLHPPKVRVYLPSAPTQRLCSTAPALQDESLIITFTACFCSRAISSTVGHIFRTRCCARAASVSSPSLRLPLTRATLASGTPNPCYLTSSSPSSFALATLASEAALALSSIKTTQPTAFANCTLPQLPSNLLVQFRSS
jgi:hypothetical protein